MTYMLPIESPQYCIKVDIIHMCMMYSETSLSQSISLFRGPTHLKYIKSGYVHTIDLSGTLWDPKKVSLFQRYR